MSEPHINLGQVEPGRKPPKKRVFIYGDSGNWRVSTKAAWVRLERAPGPKPYFDISVTPSRGRNVGTILVEDLNSRKSCVVTIAVYQRAKRI